MHRGVREFIRWVQDQTGGMVERVEPPASAKALNELEQRLGTPLPADFRHMLAMFDGAMVPSGTLLSTHPGPGNTIEAALKHVADGLGHDLLDPENLLPFHRSEHDTFLAFERSAAPVPDTWPVVDYDPETQAVRLVHRTFDGWCRFSVAEWSSEDWEGDFSIEKYLGQGQRHATVEPDVSIAHVQVAHALRRAGRPEDSLNAYLTAARCVPAEVWADWEALKLAALLSYPADAFEAGSRLGSRAPDEVWTERSATPSQVAYALAVVAPPVGPGQDPWLRILDLLVSQAVDDDDRRASSAIRAAVAGGTTPLPSPHPIPEPTVIVDADLDASFARLGEAYRAGETREDDLLLDPTLRPLAARFDLADILRIRRPFS